MNQATYLKAIPDMNGTAQLYKLEKPVSFQRSRDDDTEYQTRFVIVQATDSVCVGDRTEVFPANIKGQPVSAQSILHLDEQDIGEAVRRLENPEETFGEPEFEGEELEAITEKL